MLLSLIFVAFIINISFAYEELEGIIDKELIKSNTDENIERLVDESIKSGRYDILLELRIRDLLERAKTSTEKEYYSYLLIKYTQDTNLLETYGPYISPDNIIKLCKNDLKVKTALERYKSCFEVHKDGRFFRGIYAVMNLRDGNTRRWMENKITEVKLYKEYAYHAMGLMYYRLNERRKSILFLQQAGRLGLAPLIKVYINLRDYKKAREYADRLRAYKDLNDEEVEALKFIDKIYETKN